jgi:hypothetical protein
LTIGGAVTVIGAILAFTLIKRGASVEAPGAQAEPIPAEAAESELTLV